MTKTIMVVDDEQPYHDLYEMKDHWILLVHEEDMGERK